MSVELKVPEVGESITEVQIGRWLKNQGDAVGKDDPLVEIETDKITLELPAPAAGRLGKLLKQQGDDAQVGDVIGYLEEGDGQAAPQASSTSAAAAPEKKPAPKSDRKPASGATEQPRIMPAAQRLLDENGLAAADVHATGPGGRLLKEDVQRHLEGKQATPAEPASAGPSEQRTPEPKAKPAPTPATSAGAATREEESVPMSPMRRRIAQRLVEAQQTAALLTTFNEVDMSHVMDLRNRYKDDFLKTHNVKLGFMSFFVKASIEALKAFPGVNAEIRGSNIIYKNYYDIGIAIGSGKGLVVPIVRDADHLSFAGIEKAIGDFAQKVKDNKLALEDLQGGTFTITNGGIFGSMMSTPIINPPQSGVLGMHAITPRPMAVNGEVKIRPMMYLALTYDHRLVDGREAVSFLKRIKDLIEDPARLLMEV